MEKSFRFDLSLSRDLELLRVSRLTDASTGTKSDTDTWQNQPAVSVFLQGSGTRRRIQNWGRPGASAQVPRVLPWGQG